VLDGRGELAGGQGVECTKTRVELRGGDAALAIEPAEKIGGGTVAFEGIAFEAGRDQVPVGIAASFDAGHDVIEAVDAGVRAAQAIEAVAALAEVDGLAEGAGAQEVEMAQVSGLGVRRAGKAGWAASGEDARTASAHFIGQAHLDDMAGFAAMDESESTEDDEAADRFADRAGADANAASEPGNGKAKLELAFEAGMADEMGIDGAIGDGQMEARKENVLELLPEARGVEFLEFHGLISGKCFEFQALTFGFLGTVKKNKDLTQRTRETESAEDTAQAKACAIKENAPAIAGA
jgi:hypothetical protein